MNDVQQMGEMITVKLWYILQTKIQS